MNATSYTTRRDEQERREYITRQVNLVNLVARLEQVKQSTERINPNLNRRAIYCLTSR